MASAPMKMEHRGTVCEQSLEAAQSLDTDLLLAASRQTVFHLLKRTQSIVLLELLVSFWNLPVVEPKAVFNL